MVLGVNGRSDGGKVYGRNAKKWMVLKNGRSQNRPKPLRPSTFTLTLQTNVKISEMFKLENEPRKSALISIRIKCEYLNATNRDQKDNIFATNNWYLGYDKCT